MAARIATNKRGSMLVDVMVTVFLLGIAGVIFSASFPSGIACTRKAQNYKMATAIAQKKMEQLRAMNYELLDHPHLFSAGAIDSSPSESPYSFTQVEDLASQLPGAAGSLRIRDISGALREAVITITWREKTGAPLRRVTLTSMFTDKRTRRVM